MDKYDELLESVRDDEVEDYYLQQKLNASVETKEKQERLCRKMRNSRSILENTMSL